MQTNWPNTRIIVATHTKELIEQNCKELKSYWPDAFAGIYSAGLNSRHVHHPVIFAGIQSVYKRAYDFGKIDLLIIDEAHLVNEKDGTQYSRFIRDLKKANPNICILGLSATPYRLDNGLLYEGDGKLFDSLIYAISLKRLIDEGWLSPVISKGGVKKIDLSGVKKTAGEYNRRDLEEAADQEILIKEAVNEITAYGKERKSWLIFAAGINHARHIRDEVRERGISCEMVTGKTQKEERAQILAAFKAQKIRCLVNVQILVAGFNAPCVDLLALMMATQSTSRYVQAVGRGTRTCDGKDNCLLLDYGGNVERHGVLDEVEPESKNKTGNGEAPAKECPECMAIIHASIRVCPECGHEFPPPKPQHTGKSYDGAVLSDQEGAQWRELADPPEYLRWPGKNGKPDTIRCNFYCFNRQQPYSMWLAPDHGGYAARKALEYVRACGGVSETVDHALKEMYHWRDPTAIQVKKDPKNKKYWKIVGFEFPD